MANPSGATVVKATWFRGQHGSCSQRTIVLAKSTVAWIATRLLPLPVLTSLLHKVRNGEKLYVSNE